MSLTKGKGYNVTHTHLEREQNEGRYYNNICNRHTSAACHTIGKQRTGFVDDLWVFVLLLLAFVSIYILAKYEYTDRVRASRIFLLHIEKIYVIFKYKIWIVLYKN